jgi:hypothetical protein
MSTALTMEGVDYVREWLGAALDEAQQRHNDALNPTGVTDPERAKKYAVIKAQAAAEIADLLRATRHANKMESKLEYDTSMRALAARFGTGDRSEEDGP